MKVHLIMQTRPYYNSTTVVEAFTSKRAACEFIERFDEADRLDGWHVEINKDPSYGVVHRRVKNGPRNELLEYIKIMDTRKI